MASTLASPAISPDIRINWVLVGPAPNGVARVLGVSRQRVGQIEDMRRLPSSCVDRHLWALDVATLSRQGRR